MIKQPFWHAFDLNPIENRRWKIKNTNEIQNKYYTNLKYALLKYALNKIQNVFSFSGSGVFAIAKAVLFVSLTATLHDGDWSDAIFLGSNFIREANFTRRSCHNLPAGQASFRVNALLIASR